MDERTGRVVGVEATWGPDKEPRTYRAPIVVAADGVSGRLPARPGREQARRPADRGRGAPVLPQPRHIDDYLESWLELRGKNDADKLLPGYGWIFGMGDGRVNVGLGVLNSSVEFGKSNYREMLLDWMGCDARTTGG